MIKNTFMSLLIPLLLLLLWTPAFSGAGGNSPRGALQMDRVVAFIDEEAITLSELEDAYARAVKINLNATKLEVLNTLVNSCLLLQEARRLRIDAPTEKQMLREYIDLRVKAFVRVAEADIREFYDKNTGEFFGLQFASVKGDIAGYLKEKEVNLRLTQHIEELRAKAYVKLQLD